MNDLRWDLIGWTGTGYFELKFSDVCWIWDWKLEGQISDSVSVFMF